MLIRTGARSSLYSLRTLEIQDLRTDITDTSPELAFFRLCNACGTKGRAILALLIPRNLGPVIWNMVSGVWLIRCVLNAKL